MIFVNLFSNITAPLFGDLFSDDDGAFLKLMAGGFLKLQDGGRLEINQ